MVLQVKPPQKDHLDHCHSQTINVFTKSHCFYNFAAFHACICNIYVVEFRPFKNSTSTSLRNVADHGFSTLIHDSVKSY